MKLIVNKKLPEIDFNAGDKQDLPSPILENSF